MNKDKLSKTRRQRVPNFTADEKALLINLIKTKPILESKLTDGPTVVKKQAAWESLAQEFNSNAHVHKRETLTLKRAWDNLKAFTRKSRTAERGNLRADSRPVQLPPSPKQEACLVEDPASVVLCEINNTFDSDGVNDHTCPEMDTSHSFEESKSGVRTFVELQEDRMCSPTFEDKQDDTPPKKRMAISHTNNERKPSDLIRREATMRIRHLENRKKLEMKILETQLEVEEIKKRSALLEEQRNRLLLEKTEIEFIRLKNNENLK